MPNIRLNTDTKQSAKITLTSNVKRVAGVKVSAVGTTKVGNIETKSFIGPKGDKGDKGDTAYPEWGNITGDIDKQEDLIERLNSLTAGQTQWGNITGDISEQEDLTEVLNAKQDAQELANMINDRTSTMIDLTQEQ